MSADQLATQAVDAISSIRTLEVDNSNPMRHIARGLKHEAEAVLCNAFRQSLMLSNLARQAIEDGEKFVTSPAKDRHDAA